MPPKKGAGVVVEGPMGKVIGDLKNVCKALNMTASPHLVQRLVALAQASEPAAAVAKGKDAKKGAPPETKPLGELELGAWEWGWSGADAERLSKRIAALSKARGQSCPELGGLDLPGLVRTLQQLRCAREFQLVGGAGAGVALYHPVRAGTVDEGGVELNPAALPAARLLVAQRGRVESEARQRARARELEAQLDAALGDVRDAASAAALASAGDALGAMREVRRDAEDDAQLARIGARLGVSSEEVAALAPLAPRDVPGLASGSKLVVRSPAHALFGLVVRVCRATGRKEVEIASDDGRERLKISELSFLPDGYEAPTAARPADPTRAPKAGHTPIARGGGRGGGGGPPGMSKRIADELANPAKASGQAGGGGASKARRADEEPRVRTAANTVDVRGSRVEEATKTAQDFIERSIGAGRERVYVLHGHGTGALKAGVRAWLKREMLVRKFEPGNSDEGGDGVTMVVVGAPPFD